jgi:RNase P protein component
VDCDFLGGGWSVSAREYYHQRNEFDIAPRFAKNGVSQFSLTTSTNSLIVITGGVINAIQDRANSKLLSYSASEVAPKQMGAIFVEPPMAEQSENLFVANEAAVGGQSRLLAVNQLYSSGSLLLIMGKREAGKTILLHELAVNRLRDFGCDVRLGLVVDLSTIPRLTESAILDRAAEFLGNEMRRREIVKLLEAGEVLLCLDNLHLHKTAQVELVRAVVAKFKKSRFVVSANEETVDDLSIEAIPSLGIPVRRVYIHSFRRKQTKELVRKWFGDTDAASAKKLEIVTQLFERLNVPRTPFIISVLLWVIEQKPSSVLINQAAAIEVLIEGLLEKFKESKARVEFDSNVQQHFLEELSAHLDAQSVEWMTSFHFDEFVIFYFKKKGLQVSTRGFAEELIRKGLVYESGDRVAFKFDCFRAYFLARRFAKDSDLWRKALSKENVHRYVAELDLFTGLHRDRADVLEAAATVCSTLFLSADCDVELTNIQDLGKDAFPLDDERIVSLQNEVLTDGTRIHEDYLSRTDIPTKVSMDHNEGRKRRSILSSSPQIRFMESLRVLSIVLRNSELVDDVELKRKCFGSALKYWAQAMLSGLMAARIENLRLEIESMPQELQAIGAEKISFLMRTIFPTVIQTMLSETLTTPKLQLFVSERVEDSVVVIRMFAIFLALDNRHSGSLKMVRGFLKDNRKNTMVAQSVFFKLLSIYMHRAAERLNVVELRECLADAFSALRGAGLKENSVLKAQFLQSLDKKMTSDTSIGG